MKKIILFTGLFLYAVFAWAQKPPAEYGMLIKKAFSLYEAKAYKNSAVTYSAAFKANGWKGLIEDRYNAACSWALAKEPDSAFYHLQKISAYYINYDHIREDKDLVSLHTDQRWIPLTESIEKNKEKLAANYNQPLVKRLDSIYKDDQGLRHQLDTVEKKYGANSPEMNALWKSMLEKDSLNLIKVKAILDQYGWLGSDVVSESGNSTLFLVIQHADLATQQKYLPMMRQAVKNGKARGASLALLEDRVALGEGRKQVYGSQISRDPKTSLYYLANLADPDHIDERRAAVGLGPLADYVSQWQIKWDLEAYKKANPPQ